LSNFCKALLIIRNQKIFISIFTILITLVALIYKYQTSRVYYDSPYYTGTLHVKLGYYVYIEKITNLNKTNIMFGKDRIMKKFSDNHDVSVIFFDRKNNDIILSSTDKNKKLILERIKDAFLFINELNSDYFNVLKEESNLRITEYVLAKEESDIIIVQKKFGLNIYFILTVFLLGLISSILLSVLLDKIKLNSEKKNV